MRSPRLPVNKHRRSTDDSVATASSAVAYLRDRVDSTYADLLTLLASEARKPRVSAPSLRQDAALLRSAERAVRKLGDSRLAVWLAFASSRLATDLESLSEEIERATSHALCYDFDPLFESDGRLLYAFLSMKFGAFEGFPLPSVSLLMAGAVAGELESPTRDKSLRHEQWRKRRRVALKLFKDYASDLHMSLQPLTFRGKVTEPLPHDALEVFERVTEHRWSSEELDHLEELDRAREARMAARQGKRRRESRAEPSPGSDSIRPGVRRPVPQAREASQDREDESVPRGRSTALRPRDRRAR